MIKDQETARCLHCGGEIVCSTFAGMGGWEPDYDPSNDPRTWRHKNGYAACLSERFATPRPEIICLCGSTKFRDEFEDTTRRFGLEGKIVLTVACFGHMGDLPPEACIDGHPTKTALDNLHKRKIDVADRVFVIDVGGYIGTSTRSEIDYAEAHGKPVEYLSGRTTEVTDNG